MADDSWYREALYEQSWENYRNEDENFRGTMWQYLVFVAAIVYAASQAQAATRLVAFVGLFISLITAFYALRIQLYSRRWLLAKDAAVPAGTSEAAYLGEARRIYWFAFVPGWLLALAFPVAGAFLFSIMCFKGTGFWC